MPETTTPRKLGGPAFHKNPDCKCNACSSRRRKEEAVAQSDRTGRDALVSNPQAIQKRGIVDADMPLMTQGRSVKDRVAQWVLIRQQEPGIKNAEVARRLGIGVHHLNTLISRAHKEGWLRFDDPISRLEHEIIPKVMDNLSLFLDQKDKQVTIEAAKGTIFKSYQESKGITETPQTVVAIRIEAADPDSTRVITGTIVGQGREIIDTEVEK